MAETMQGKCSAESKTVRCVLLAVVVLVMCGCLSAQVNKSHPVPCSNQQSSSALDVADSLRSWDALHKSFLKYGNCDDGAIAEGFSESVARIFVEHWETLPRLSELSKKDAGFYRFAMKHVDATLNVDDLVKIKEDATRHCPSGLSNICRELQSTSKRAIEEIDETTK
jgi:hypothetical protein